jgi:hypothetical protein
MQFLPYYIDMENKKAPQEKESFFQSIIASLFKSSNPDVEKKRRLKLIAKNIAKRYDIGDFVEVEALSEDEKRILKLYRSGKYKEIVNLMMEKI